MITLSLISQIVIAGASVMFAPVETSTPPVQYYNEMTNTITPCNTSIQDASKAHAERMVKVHNNLYPHDQWYLSTEIM